MSFYECAFLKSNTSRHFLKKSNIREGLTVKGSGSLPTPLVSFPKEPFFSLVLTVSS